MIKLPVSKIFPISIKPPSSNVTVAISSPPFKSPTQTEVNMPPKRVYIEKPSRRAPKGVLGSTYETLTSPENAAVVRAITVFGVS